MNDKNRPADPDNDSSDEVSGYGLAMPLPIPSRTEQPGAEDKRVPVATDPPPDLASDEYKGVPMPFPSGKKLPEKDGGPTSSF